MLPVWYESRPQFLVVPARFPTMPEPTPARMTPPACEDTARSGADATTPTLSESLPAAESFGLLPVSWSSCELSVGSVVGDVTITRVIADGGMGRVYEGLQASPRRRVAVKMLRPDRVSPARIRRLALEAEVLGQLKHPHVAQIYAAATHRVDNHDLPCLIMEYVEDSLPITDHVQTRGLSRRDRLLLFRDVCRAVGSGHASGIIHRDLKPANILVDGRGSPKVIDFGIARVITGDSTEMNWGTTVGDLVGTAAYMSPEQFDPDLGKADARTDVYALGTILHELLAGCHPFALQGLPLHEVARVIREQPPRPLIGILPDIGKDAAAVVAKCLAKEKSRRYEHAHALADDVERLVDGVAVLATPPSFLDESLRFVRRHRVAAIATAMAILSLAASAAGILIFAVEASHQAALARRGRDQADAALAFLVNAFRAPDPSRDGRDVTVAETLTTAVEALREPRQGGIEDPSIRSSILAAVGTTLKNLGMPREAVELLEEARDLARGTPEELAVASLVAQALAGTGDFAAAEAGYRALLEQPAAARDPAVLAETLRGLAENENRLNELDDAEQHAAQALAILEAQEPVAPAPLVETLKTLGGIAYSRARFEEALTLYDRALHLAERSLGKRHVSTLQIMRLTALAACKQGQYDRAQRLFEEELSTSRAVFGREHPQVAAVLQAYGQLLNLRGRFSEAETSLLESLVLTEKSLGATHPAVAPILECLAYSCLKQRQYTEAEAFLLRSRSIYERTFGEDHLSLAQTLGLLSWAKSCLRQPEEALALGQRALAIRREKLGDDNAETARSMVSVATAQIGLGDHAACETLATEALAIFERLYGPDHRLVTSAVDVLSRLRSAQGRHDEAVALARRTLAIHARVFGEKNPETLASRERLAARLREAGRAEEALSLAASSPSKDEANSRDGGAEPPPPRISVAEHEPP
jgi:tetratricopeptide (TPR) repeat protein/tRNA A-37 threonylcarbamoyl transferase component Bud32